MLTWKCASRHNGVHFFDISASKSAPSMVCVVRFDLEMCLAPPRRALFRCLNFQECSDISTFKNAPKLRFCTFWLRNVLRATTACNSAIFHVSSARWLCTRRFSEPTFRPSWATNHWKNTVIRDFSTFSRTCIFVLLTLSLLWSSCFFSALLWPFPPLLFHLSILPLLPSIIYIYIYIYIYTKYQYRKIVSIAKHSYDRFPESITPSQRLTADRALEVEEVELNEVLVTDVRVDEMLELVPHQHALQLHPLRHAASDFLNPKLQESGATRLPLESE